MDFTSATIEEIRKYLDTIKCESSNARYHEYITRMELLSPEDQKHMIDIANNILFCQFGG